MNYSSSLLSALLEYARERMALVHPGVEVGLVSNENHYLEFSAHRPHARTEAEAVVEDVCAVFDPPQRSAYAIVYSTTLNAYINDPLTGGARSLVGSVVDELRRKLGL